MSTAAINGEVICPHCGTRNPAGANFCNRCGAALAGELEPPPADPAAPLGAFPADAPFPADAAAGAITGVRPEEPVAPAHGPAVEQVDEPDLDRLLAAPPASPTVPGGPIAPAAPALPPADFVPFPDEQLLGGSGGYLDVVAIAGDATTPLTPPDRPVVAGGAGAVGDAEHWRTLRSLLRDEPILAAAAAAAPAPANYYPLWITLLVLAAALLPFFFGALLDALPATRTPAGVPAAFDALATLQVDDAVLVLWQADPATTGELNLVALPVVSHLLERGARSIVFSLQPAGLGAARRLYSEATRGMDASVMETVLQGWVGSGVFLSGGATALPLAARDTAQLLSFAATEPPAPQLALLVTPDAEDVQRWLEIVQPVNHLRVVAVTSAAAEPLLRPYVQSGQLAGLVSGFDGATAYQTLRREPLGAAAQRKLALAVNAQSGGALALLLIAVGGNLAHLFRRERRG